MQTRAIALTQVLGAGKAKDGTLYVADAGDSRSSGSRLFVATGGALERKRVTGQGSSGGGADADYTLSFEDGATTRRLVIQVRASKVTGIALTSDTGKGFFADLGSDAERLTVVDSKTVASMPVHNLPGKVVIEYLAHTSAGDTLLVTRPQDDSTYDDFKLFFGKSKQLLERELTTVSRARDGGSTTLGFLVDGVEYTAHFPVVSTGTSFMPGPATLDTGRATLSLTRDATQASTLAGFSYLCRAP